jgi:hypothetical protein
LGTYLPHLVFSPLSVLTDPTVLLSEIAQLQTPRQFFSNFGGESAVNVRSFGAVGNGTTPDHAAVNSAIAFIAAQGGGNLYFPKGTYLFTDHVLVTTGNIKIYGNGPGVSIIKVGAFIDGFTVANGYPTGLGTLRNIEICDIEIDGGQASYVSPNDTYGNGINLNSCENFFVHHCYVHDCSQQGILSTFFGPPPYTATQRQGSICDNIVDISTSTHANIAIGVEGHHARVTVARNTIYCSSNGTGVAASNAGETGMDNGETIIHSNIIVGLGSSGWLIKAEFGWHMVSIVGNQTIGGGIGVRVNNQAGDTAAGCIVDGNTCRGFASEGIYLEDDNGSNKILVRVSNNVLFSALAVTAAIVACPYSSISDNEIQVEAVTLAGILFPNNCFVTTNRILVLGAIGLYCNGVSDTSSYIFGNMTTGTISNPGGFAIFVSNKNT